jgi:hypothetical protein
MCTPYIGLTNFDVSHLNLLLLESVPRLALAMIKCAVTFLAAIFHFLAHAVVFALLLAKFGVLAIAFLFQLGSIVTMQFPQFFVSSRERLQWIGELGD